MTVDGSRLAGNMLLLNPQDPAAEHRARLAVAGYARREHPRSPRLRRALCAELLDMLGLLEAKP